MSQFRCVASSLLSRQRGLRRRIPCPSLNIPFSLGLVSDSHRFQNFYIPLYTKLELKFLTISQGRSLVRILLTLSAYIVKHY